MAQIPTSGSLGSVYFNVLENPEKVLEILQTLTYTQTPYLASPIYPILVTSTGWALFAVYHDSSDGDSYEITWGNIATQEFEYCFYGAMFGGIPAFAGFLKKELSINSSILSSFNGFPVGTENNKLANIISATSFNINDNGIINRGYLDTVYFNTFLSTTEVDEVLSKLTYFSGSDSTIGGSIFMSVYSPMNFELYTVGAFKSFEDNSYMIVILDANTNELTPIYLSGTGWVVDSLPVTGFIWAPLVTILVLDFFEVNIGLNNVDQFKQMNYCEQQASHIRNLISSQPFSTGGTYMANLKQIKIGSTVYNIEPYTAYLPLTGGILSGNLHVGGNIQTAGNITFKNTYTLNENAVTSGPSVSNTQNSSSFNTGSSGTGNTGAASASTTINTYTMTFSNGILTITAGTTSVANGSHTHTGPSHTHSVGAHSHGLNSHTHTFGHNTRG